MSHQATLPTDSDSITDSNSEDSNRLVLTYMSNRRNMVSARIYINHGEFVREVDREWMYNYASEQWESTKRFVHDYRLCDDGETLAGDGSNWRGTNRNWMEWFKQRSVELLNVRLKTESDEVTSEVYETETELPKEIAEMMRQETGKITA